MQAKERFEAVYDAIPTITAQDAITIAEYATPWKEVFIGWILDSEVHEAKVSWGVVQEAERVVDIQLRDADGTRFTRPLTISTSYLRISSKKKSEARIAYGKV
jgi:hypothetical protein